MHAVLIHVQSVMPKLSLCEHRYAYVMDHETLLLSLLSTFVSMDYFLSFCHMICLFFAPNPFTTPSAIPLARIAIPVVLVFFSISSFY